jgi:Mce-associated membrane protein
MEGDAGASRLNPTDANDSASTEVKAEDSPESEVGTEQASTEASGTEMTAEDSPESEDGTEASGTEMTAEDSPESEDGTEASETAVERGPSRLGRGWLAGIAAALVLLAGAIGAGGYIALRYHQESQATARNDAAALKAAIDCVAATQAPDTNAMVASERKIIDCGTDAYRSQALLYSSMLVQAYQAANVHVQVSDVRGAVERNNTDGTVDVLVAMRVNVSGDQTKDETGYRLRVKMALAEGQYKISKLDQVTK